MSGGPHRDGEKGERSLAQRPLPLRPPPETWGRFDSPPHPLTTQRGGAAAPPLWIPLPGIRERQRKEKQVKSILHPDLAILGRGLTTERFSKTGPAPNAESCLNCPMSLVGTPRFKQKRRLLAPVLRPSGFLLDRERPVFFGRNPKKMGGSFPRSPLPGDHT